MLSFWKYWAPALIWMSIIFSASGDTRSTEHSSRLIAPLLRWLKPSITPQAIDLAVITARKGAHLTEYGILALLLWRATRSLTRPKTAWRWSDAWLTMGLAILYAATDELHQLFVPNRTGHISDVLIDGCGAAVALLLLWFVIWWRQRTGPR